VCRHFRVRHAALTKRVSRLSLGVIRVFAAVRSSRSLLAPSDTDPGRGVDTQLLMRPLRFLVAVTASVAVILSAPFFQQLFSTVSTNWGPQSRMLGISATAIPIGIALLAAVARIRDRRTTRYLMLAGSLLLGAVYIVFDALSFTECFHFVEYGLLAWLFYRSALSVGTSPALIRGSDASTGDDGSVIVLPLLAGVIVGTLDEWFQWFIPIRAGEARDVILDIVATACGLLFALSLEPPRWVGFSLRRHSLRRVAACAGVAVAVFAFFIVSVHVGYEVRDPRIGTFRARYSATQLSDLSSDRAERWAVEPPVVLRRLSREDQYLSEGLWHVQRRNAAWDAGEFATAWRENLILETFYAPVLDAPTIQSSEGHRWPPEQRADIEQRPGVDRGPVVSDVYRYPLLVWPGTS